MARIELYEEVLNMKYDFKDLTYFSVSNMDLSSTIHNRPGTILSISSLSVSYKSASIWSKQNGFPYLEEKIFEKHYAPATLNSKIRILA